MALFAVAAIAPSVARADSVKPALPSTCFCPYLGNVLEDAALGHFVFEAGTRVATFVVDTPLLPDATGRMRSPGERIEWSRDVPVAESIGYFIFGQGGAARCAEQVAPSSSDPDLASVVALDCSGGRSIEASGLGMCVERVTVSDVLRLVELLHTDPAFECNSAFVAETGLDGVRHDGCTSGPTNSLALIPAMAAFLLYRRSRAAPTSGLGAAGRRLSHADRLRQRLDRAREQAHRSDEG